MLSKKTRKRIREHKWNEHSNAPQFLSRLKDQTDVAIEDQTLIAKNLDEKQLEKIFTAEKLEPFIKSLLTPTNTSESSKTTNYLRLFFLSQMFLKYSLNLVGVTIENKWAKQLYQQHELPLRQILESVYHERKKLIERTTKKSKE